MGMVFEDSTLKRIDDIIEVESFIIVVGSDHMESFTFYQGKLTRGAQIKCENDTSEIKTIALYDKLFLVGHQSGSLSAWVPDPNLFLACTGILKIHEGSVNKIAMKVTAINQSQFVITCSSDGTIKIFKPNENFNLIFTKTFEAGVNDFFQTVDFEGNEVFLISLDNGRLIVTNLDFENKFIVPSVSSAKHRFCLNLANPFKNDTLGNFLVVSDDNSLNFNMWIKEGSGSKPQQGGQAHKGFKKGQGSYEGGYQDDRGYQGQGRGYQDNQRGGQQGGQQGGYQGGHQGGYQGGHQGGYRGGSRGGHQGGYQPHRGGGGHRGGY